VHVGESEATSHLSTHAAAADLNTSGILTAAGGAWRAQLILRARRLLGL